MRGGNDVVAAGHVCLDVIPDLSAWTRQKVENFMRPGQLTEVGPATLATGGAVSNTGLALHKLGISTRLMGKVGDDLLGQALLKVLASYGPHLADGMVVDPSALTSYTIILSPPGMDRIFLHCPGANDTFSADDVRYDLVAQGRLLHFGYPPLMKKMFEDDGEQLVQIFRSVKELGVTTSLDVAVPDPTSAAGHADWLAILRAVIPYVDVFLPSIEETLYMLRRETFEALSQAAGGASFLPLITPSLLSDLSFDFLELGAKIVGFKLGNRGLYMRTSARSAIEAMGAARPSDPEVWASRELWSPCFQVNVAGTTGSGDATIAGFLSALLRDMLPETALTAAVAVGACNVEAADALSGLETWDETRARLQAGWARVPLVLGAPTWRFDSVRQLWFGPADCESREFPCPR